MEQINNQEETLDIYKCTIIGQLSLIDELQEQNLRLIANIKFLKDEINLLTYATMQSAFANTKEIIC